MTRRCPQCWQQRPLEDFRSEVDRRRMVNWCISCRRYYRGDKPKPRSWRGGAEDQGELRVRIVRETRNRKTGPIVSTMTSACTCPRSCPWYGNGCYSEYHVLGYRWRETSETGLGWGDFCGQVKGFEAGVLWRHNVAGDLPGVDGEISAFELQELCFAAQHTRGFTYTHKPLTDLNVTLLRAFSGEPGLCINLSVDGMGEVDAAADLNCGPVVVVLPADAPREQRTKAGRRVVVCSAQLGKGQCATCGLCAVREREVVVGFRAHGCASKRVSQRVGQLRLWE